MIFGGDVMWPQLIFLYAEMIQIKIINPYNTLPVVLFYMYVEVEWHIKWLFWKIFPQIQETNVR